MILSFTDELGIFSQVVNYKEYEECLRSLLGKCHTQEQLDTAKVAIEEVKARLMDTNPEFRGIIGTREQAVKLKSEYEQAIHRAKMSEAKADAKSEVARITAEASSKIRDREAEDWVAKTRYKTYEPDVKEKEIQAGLWCPICQEENKRGNMVNGKPTCTKCWHKLVPKDKLKDYPRKYRRAWKL